MGEKNPLAKYSVAALLEEIAKRERVRSERKPIEHFCDECSNFKFWQKTGDPPDGYNPCAVGHKMSFRVPEGYSETEYGYYRRVCRDRKLRLSPTAESGPAA